MGYRETLLFSRVQQPDYHHFIGLIFYGKAALIRKITVHNNSVKPEAVRPMGQTIVPVAQRPRFEFAVQGQVQANHGIS